MCDYSLMQLPNRLAVEGEDLIAYRFPSGSMGLTSPADLNRVAEPKISPRQAFWAAVKRFFDPVGTCNVPAVCIPPGARLKLLEIGHGLQREYGLHSEEPGLFEQLSASANTYRDAIRFGNGSAVRLQELPEGQRVVVVSLNALSDLEEELVAGGAGRNRTDE